MIVVILVILITTICYYLLKVNYQYWEKRGIAGPKPKFLIGNSGKAILMQELPGRIYSDIYKKYQNEDVVGVYRLTTPALIVRNPDLIKEITVKSFSSFHNNDIHLKKEHDPLFARNPFNLKGDEWKMVRGQLTPGFTSAKMKWMYPLLEENGLNLIKCVEDHPETANGQGYEAKELCTRFTLDNVATCAFGLKGKCLTEENSEFRKLGNDFFSTGTWTAIIFFLVTLYPELSKILPLRFLSKSVEKRLIEIVSQTVKYREENNVVRNDFLQIMCQLKKTCNDYDFLDIDVAAHAAGFFGDGYETSSIVMSFAIFEIAANPEVQRILRDEVVAAFDDKTGQISYENLQSLEYLEAVIWETLRKHPVIFLLQKLCNRTFIYTSSLTNKTITIEEGTPIILPVYGLHHDPKYFEEPQTFMPERFLESNKKNLEKYAFLPFGEGPRACLGQRFGLLQIKVGIAHLVKNYELSVNSKTQLPIKYLTSSVLTAPVGGLWLDFKKLK